MNQLTVIVPCKNEAVNIRACLDTVRWADEIFIVDSGSTDETIDIAREFTSRIVQHEYINSAAQKNWAIPQATHEWILVVDADERVTPELQAEIKELLSGTPSCDGYYIYRKNWFFGVPISRCGWERDKVLRLFKRDKSRYQNKHVHAEVEITGPKGFLKSKLEHYTYRSFDQYLEKFNRYTTWSALDLKARGRKPSAWNMISHPVMRFIRMYLFRKGFLDGTAGLILCMLASFSVFMKYAKLWAIIRAEAGEKGVEIGKTQW